MKWGGMTIGSALGGGVPGAALGGAAGEAGHQILQHIFTPGEAPKSALQAAGGEAIAGAETGAAELGGKIVGKAGSVLWQRLAQPEVAGLEKVGSSLGAPTSPEALSLAGRNAPDAIDAGRNIDLVKKDLAQIERNNPVTQKGSSASFQYAKNIKDYANELWEQGHIGPITRNAGIAIDPSAMTSAVERTLTPEAIAADKGNRAIARRLTEWANDQLSTPRNLSQADTLLRELNADIDAASSSATKPYGPLEFRVKDEVTKALRKEIETKLVEKAGETGVRDINMRFGALSDIAERTAKQGVDVFKAEAKKGPLPDWLRVYSWFHVGPEGVFPSVGISGHPEQMFEKNASQQLQKGMKLLARSGLEAPPRPPMYGPEGAGPWTAPAPPPTGPMPLTRPPVEQVGGLPPAGFPAVQQLGNPAATATNLWGEPTTRISTGAGLYGEEAAAEARRMAMGGQGRIAPRRAFGPGGETQPVIGQGTYMGRPEPVAGRGFQTQPGTGGVALEIPGRNPPKGVVANAFKQVGMDPQLLTPRQQQTLETMVRGPRWRDMEGVDKAAAINRILSGERF